MSKRKTSVLGHLLVLSVPAVALSLLSFEFALRLVGYTPFYLDGNAFVPSQNPEIRYELRPRFEGYYAGVPIYINALGFRGKELSDNGGQPALRILVLGDSIAFGQGVHENETLARQLEARLQKKLHTSTEVVNVGVPTYNTCQEYRRFRQRALALEARAAVLLYVDNDPDPPLLQVIGAKVISSDVRTGWFGDLMASLRKYSAAYNFVWTRWQILKYHRSSVDEYRQMLDKKFDAGNPGWKKSKACLAELISLAHESSIRLIVVPFPELSGLAEKPYPYEKYVKTVCDAARSQGAECLDVVPLLQEQKMRLRVSAVDSHPSADVYKKIAEHLAERLP